MQFCVVTKDAVAIVAGMVGHEGKDVVEHEVGGARVCAGFTVILNKVNNLVLAKLLLDKVADGGGHVIFGGRWLVK